MCGRFTLTVDSLEFIEAVQRLNVKLFGGGDFKPRFNVAPTQLHPIILADGEDFAVPACALGIGQLLGQGRQTRRSPDQRPFGDSGRVASVCATLQAPALSRPG